MYEYWKSNINNSKRTAINTRAIWGVISCDTTNSFKLGKMKRSRTMGDDNEKKQDNGG